MQDFILPVTIAGIEFKNPFYVASGPTARTVEQLVRIEQAGWAAASIKLSIDPKPYINRVPRYALFPQYNALAFTAEKRLYFEQGLKLVRDAKKILTDLKVMANITYAGDDGIAGWVRMAQAFEAAGADIIEFNMCCPNMSFNAQVTAGDENACERKTGASLGRNAAIVSEIAAAVKQAIGIPLFVKLTPEGGEIAEVAHALFQVGVDAVGGTGNRLGIPPIDLEQPGKAIYHLQDEISMSCYSGAWLKPLAQRDTYEMRKVCGPNAALTATGGIRNAKDALEMAMCGADLLGICSETLIRGYDFIGDVIQETRRWLTEHGHSSLRDVRDLIVPSIRSAPELTLYSGYARVSEPALSAPCRAACPAGVPIQTLMKKVAEEKYDEAMAALDRIGPLQEVCGLLCDAPCERACVKEKQTTHLQIREMERFLARRSRLQNQGRAPEAMAHPGSDAHAAAPAIVSAATPAIASAAAPAAKARILVREASLAGIMCALDLLRQGYRVALGPMPDDEFYSLLPETRLPSGVLESAQQALDHFGVERLTEAAAQGLTVFAACYQPARLQASDNVAPDAISALSLLAMRRKNRTAYDTLALAGKSVLIVGNGLLAAETARILKSDDPARAVIVLTESDTPSRFLSELANEQIPVVSGVSGTFSDNCFTGRQKRSGVTVQYTFGLAVDASENFLLDPASPAAAKVASPAASTATDRAASEVTVVPPADTVGFVLTDAGRRLDLSPVVLIAAGQQAAAAIDQQLRAGVDLAAAPAVAKKAVVRPQDVLPRKPYPASEPVVRLSRSQAENGFSDAQAAAEADRCLRCGCGEGCDICRTICCEFAITLDNHRQIDIHADKCVACGMCFNRCPNRNIEMVNTGTKL